MGNNIFMTDRLPIRFEEYLQYDENSRENLGQELLYWFTVCWNIP